MWATLHLSHMRSGCYTYDHVGVLIILVEEMWLWREMAELDNTLHFFNALFCFGEWHLSSTFTSNHSITPL
jgi:alcohol dehydrogenase YqhD (iron-dependent ADH family)